MGVARALRRFVDRFGFVLHVVGRQSALQTFRVTALCLRFLTVARVVRSLCVVTVLPVTGCRQRVGVGPRKDNVVVGNVVVGVPKDV